MHIPIRFCLASLFVVVAAIGSSTNAHGQPARPNFVLCMADDLGWGDTGYNGHPHIKTPNLDQMAEAGARLDRFYVGSPLCVPSRAGLLTGRIATRCGISNHRGAVSHLRAEEFTIAELVKAKGYTTGHFGKWHLGMLTPDYQGDKKVLMTPGMAGFDEWFASPSSVATHNPYTDPGGIGRALGGASSPQAIDLQAGYIHNGKPLNKPLQGCAAEIVVDRAIPFIRNAAKKEQPFLAVIWFNPPHAPVVGHPKYMEELYSHLPENQQHYYSLATAIDAQMGRLRQEFRDLGIAEDTLLAFTSDNGPGPPIGRKINANARLQGSAGPFRERKASIYEGGIREPGLIEWPSQIGPGTVVKTPCSTLDYMPTLAKLLDIELPDRPYDGLDIMPILKGEQQERGKPIAFYFRDAVALSGEQYKLVAAEQSKGRLAGGAVSFTDKKFELFDLANDPGETNDVAEDHPELVTEMNAQLSQWVDSVEQSRLGKDYDPTNSTASTSPASASRTHLFLCSGQSNMKNLDLNISFTPALRKAFPEDEVIVTKVAYGGRAISRWVPRGKIYKELLTEAMAATAGKKIDTVTFVWMQGERDHQEDATTQAYKRNLATLYDQLTEDFKREDINWVIGRLSDARLGTANWDAIREIQVDVADKHPQAAWIDTDDLNGPDDAVHCPPEGYKQMGLRFADKAVGLIKQSAAPRAETTIPEGTNVRIIPLAKPLGDAPPNVVVLFADDAGYADFGFQPNVRPDMAKLTPYIDSIAARGARCSQAYVTGAVCSPSRAGLMTGRYQERFGHETNLPPGFPSGLPLTETFGVKRLQPIGYRTGLIGKWHLGYPEDYRPNQRGFDEFYGLLQGSRSYYPYAKPSPDRVILDNDVATPETGYVTDRLGDAACKFIEANKDESFYLFVSFTAPHGPLEPRKNSDDAKRVRHIEAKNRRGYAGLVVAMDDNIGKILAALKEHGLEENTLVIFTNDNGGPQGTGTSNFPLKGHKGSLEEGGIRVPWAMSWPAVIKPGSVINQPISTLDILPTIFDVADKPVDPAWKLDGRSMLPLLRDPNAKVPQRSLYWRRKGDEGPIALRDGDWKLLLRNSRDGAPQLYDLSGDIGETTNVASKHPQVVNRMTEKLAAWEAELAAPLWGPGSSGFLEQRRKEKGKKGQATERTGVDR